MGLTATNQQPDKKRLGSVFGSYRTNLSLATGGSGAGASPPLPCRSSSAVGRSTCSAPPTPRPRASGSASPCLDRLRQGLPVDRASCPYTAEFLAVRRAVRQSMLRNPFEKFERKRFMYYSRDRDPMVRGIHLYRSLETVLIKSVLCVANIILRLYG
ncbi:MAG: hypothetical protein U0J70_08895 [Atopobiaceae bacterium]|nr:hypothetical protein [Atopobiaceae bacterium]